MKNILFIAAYLFCANALQAGITDSMKITYEKKINVHKIYKDRGEWGRSILANYPQYQSEFFTLVAAENRSMYTPVEVEDKKRSAMWGYSLDENLVYMDYTTNTFSEKKTIYEKTYLIQDTIRQIKWRVSNDKRTIAGYECRKASAIIYDSIEVYAFYCEELALSGGPEAFGGLPGMILGLAIPDISTTWFATKVEAAPPAEIAAIQAPEKGKKANYSQLNELLFDVFKEWGDWGKIFLWMNLI